MTNVPESKIKKAFELLSQEAKELYLPKNVAEIDVAEIEKEPLDFYRNYISKNLPVLIKNGLSTCSAINKWNSTYFRTKIPDKLITVAVTPNGYADAINTDPKTLQEFFIMPEEREITMSTFLDNLKNPSNDIFYIQQQNSNFESNFHELWRDAPHFSWDKKIFGKHFDAVNFWMGDKRAVTSMHKDPYENIYCVISGHKDFIIHPPTDLPWIPYKKYPSANYKKLHNGQWSIEPIEKNEIPWISIDPLNPNYVKYPEYKNATSLKVRVNAGDILYLPSLWFHHVQQSHGCIALNFWYDMDYDIKYAYYKSLELLCQ